MEKKEGEGSSPPPRGTVKDVFLLGTETEAWINPGVEKVEMQTKPVLSSCTISGGDAMAFSGRVCRKRG